MFTNNYYLKYYLKKKLKIGIKIFVFRKPRVLNIWVPFKNSYHEILYVLRGTNGGLIKCMLSEIFCVITDIFYSTLIQFFSWKIKYLMPRKLEIKCWISVLTEIDIGPIETSEFIVQMIDPRDVECWWVSRFMCCQQSQNHNRYWSYQASEKGSNFTPGQEYFNIKIYIEKYDRVTNVE